MDKNFDPNPNLKCQRIMEPTPDTAGHSERRELGFAIDVTASPACGEQATESWAPFQV